MNKCIENLNRERGTLFSLINGDVYEGIVEINGEKVLIRIDLGHGFPEELPLISVPEVRRFVPHCSNGLLCLFERDSIMIIPDMGEQLLLDCYDRAIEILSMDPQHQKNEILREFIAYWSEASRENGILLFSSLRGASLHEFKQYTAVGESYNRLVVSESISGSFNLLKKYMNIDADESQKMVNIPVFRIRLRNTVIPPLTKAPTWRMIRTFIADNITASQKKWFNKMLDEKLKIVNRIIMLIIPSPFGDQVACYHIIHQQKKTLSLRNISTCKVEPVLTARIDRDYMLARGGATKTMEGKSVLLIGCGSIGGFLAADICHCGIGTLDILDKDILSPDNVYRHILGFSDAIIGKYKSDTMKQYLEDHFPYTDIDALSFKDRRAETFIQDTERLLSYDLIVSATGDPSLNLKINDIIRNQQKQIPFVVCFNEPYSIGGHAIAILSDGGCLRCLYSDPLTGNLVAYQGSFVDPDQSFTKTLSGCAGSFVEYSALDSQQTATMTARLIMEILEGRCIESKIVSWVGQSTTLENEGFKTSSYYSELVHEQRTFVSRPFSSNQRCKTCSNL